MRFTAIPLVLLTGALVAGMATSSFGADGPSIFDDARRPAQRDSTTSKSANPKVSKPAATTQAALAKASIPDAASLSAAERLIQDLLGNDLKSASPEIRRQAAAKLLAQADGSASLAEQFAMLRRARQVAAAAGDAVTAFAAARQTVARFVLDERALRAETIAALSKSVREMADEYPSVKQAQAKLRAAPDDAAANALAGRFFCLRKHDWPTGLPFLARGNDAKLRALAAAETAAAEPDATEALKVGDAWWDYSLSPPGGIMKLVVQAHAGDWYRAALPGVTGIRKLQVQERLATASRARTQVAGQARGRWIGLMRHDHPSARTHPAGTTHDR